MQWSPFFKRQGPARGIGIGHHRRANNRPLFDHMNMTEICLQQVLEFALRQLSTVKRIGPAFSRRVHVSIRRRYDENPARPENAAYFGQKFVVLDEMFNGFERHDNIDCAGHKRNAPSIALAESKIGTAVCSGSVRHGLTGDFNANRGSRRLCEKSCPVSFAGCDVEYVATSAQLPREKIAV